MTPMEATSERIAELLRQEGMALSDELVARVRALSLSVAPATDPDLPPDVLDRGGPEALDQVWTVQGEVGVKEPEQTIREQVR